MRICFLALLILGGFTAPADDWEPRPLADLPNAIVVAPQKLSIHVDWGSAKDGMVNVYVINATDDDKMIGTLYGNVTFHQEVWTARKRWERATPHVDEMCGVGIGQHALPAQMYVVEKVGIGTRIKGTVRHKMRLVNYQPVFQLPSNEGVGFVYPQKIEIASKDSLSISLSPLPRLLDIIFSRDETFKDYQPRMEGPPDDPRIHAINALVSGDHPEDVVLKTLTPIAEGSIPDLQRWAKSALEFYQNRTVVRRDSDR